MPANSSDLNPFEKLMDFFKTVDQKSPSIKEDLLTVIQEC